MITKSNERKKFSTNYTYPMYIALDIKGCNNKGRTKRSSTYSFIYSRNIYWAITMCQLSVEQPMKFGSHGTYSLEGRQMITTKKYVVWQVTKKKN